MPTHRVTTTPSALPGTADDTTYSVQNKGPDEIHVLAAVAAPPNNAGFVIPRLGFGYPTPETGESVWVWTLAGQSLAVFQES